MNVLKKLEKLSLKFDNALSWNTKKDWKDYLIIGLVGYLVITLYGFTFWYIWEVYVI